MKSCSKCEQPLPLDSFGTDRSKKDGHRPDCKACQWAARDKDGARKSNRQWRAANLEKARSIEAAWRSRNTVSVKRKSRQYYEANKDSWKLKTAAWAQENRERLRELQREWTKRNLKKAAAWNAKRRAARLNATPPWADLDAIRRIYEQCPPGHHVDHIIPLRGKGVCGLHVHYNLQYLPARENLKKGARYG